MNDNNGENIVIAGISGRFPRSHYVEELSKNLYGKINMLTDVETSDAKIPKRRGIIDNLNKFDANCFHVSTTQAEAMAPENRVLLEVATEAIFDAGINPVSLKGSKTAVCLAQSTYDAMYTNVYSDASSDIHSFLGTSSPIAANRLSFSLGLRGVSIAIDVSCASSFVAFQLATNWIRQGDCDAVLVLTANVQSHPVISKMFARLNMVDPDGCSRPFDSNANGYVRSDTIAAILIQKQKHARRVYAMVEHVASNHDGFKVNGIIHPSGESQSELYDSLYKKVGVNPLDVHFVEAHGTGTKVGDREECQAIDKVFCKNRTGPLLIGSSKSNMGHAEGASGVISIMKAIFTFQTGLIPPNINFATVRPDIPALVEGRLKVCTEPTPLQGSFMAINVFGVGGVNVHALLRKADKWERPNRIEKLPILICWSGRTEEAVRTVFAKLKSTTIDVEFIALLHNIQKTEIKENLHRGYIVLKSDQGDAFPECVDEKIFAVEEQNKRPIIWMFSGLGSQYPKVAQHLMQIEPFANAISKCHKVLEQFNLNLISSLTHDESAFDNLVNSFVCVTAIQIALVDVLKILGVPVDFYIGHSMGEIGCAYSDGGVTLEQAIIMSYYRGKCSVDGKTTDGAMAAIGLGYAAVKDSLPPSIQVACRNSPNSCTISGPKEDILEYVDKMRSKQIFAKEVNVGNIAFHSKYVTVAGEKLLEKLKPVIPTKIERSSKWLSTSNEKDQWHTSLAKFNSAEYFVNNFLSPVYFDETCKLLPENAIVIEIAPHRLMQSVVKNLLPNAVYIPLTFREHNDQVEFLSMALGRLYMSGVSMQIDRLYPAVAFPVSQRTPMLSPLIKWNHEKDWPTFQNKAEEMVHHIQKTVYIKSSDGKYKFVDGHRIDGRCILPVAFILNLVKDAAIGAGSKAFGLNAPVQSLVFENLKFLSTTEIKPNSDIKLSISLQPTNNGKFKVYEGTTAIASGFIKCASDISSIRDIKTFHAELDLPILNSSDVYKEFRLRGYNYADEFKAIVEARMDGCYGQLKCKNNNWTTILDGMIQLILLSKDTRSLLTPVEIRRIQINVNNHFNRSNGTYLGEHLLAAYHSNEFSTVVCGSIEMNDVYFKQVERDKPDGLEVSQTHQFVPLYDAVLPSFNDAVDVCLALAVEKIQESRVTLLEVYSGDSDSAIECIYDVFQKTPSMVADLTLLAEDDGILQLNNESIKIKSSISSLEDEQYTFVVMNQCERNEKILEMAKRCLSKEGLLTFIDELHTNVTVSHDFTIISQIRCPDRILTIMQRTPIEDDNYKIIHIDSADERFEWLQKVQETNTMDNVLLVAQHDKTPGVLGLINCLRLEFDTKHLRCVIIEDERAPPFDVNVSLYHKQLLLQLPINIYRDAKWGTYRHLELKPATTQCESTKRMTVNIEQINGQRMFHWMPHIELTPSNDIVKVQYAALNFCDRLVANGTLPNDTAIKNRLDEYRPLLGFECAGVTDNQKRVMCFALRGGLLSTHISCANVDIVLEVPSTMSLRSAATIPQAYFTVYYSFFVKNSIKPGHSILINTDCGGVGLSAIRVALVYGLTVFAVVPTQQHKGFLLDNFPQLKEQNVGCCGDYSIVMNGTKNEGTDFVFNALSDDNHQQATIRCIKPGGTFMELGKFDVHKSTEFVMAALRNGIDIQSIVIEHAIQRTYERNKVIELMEEDLKRRIIHQLPLTIFAADDLENAFKFLSNSRTMGKTLVQIRSTENSECSLPITVWPRAVFEPDLVYILIGGLGGFGLEFADWMIMRGGRKLVICSRRGLSDQYQNFRIKKWESYGCIIVVNTSNITTLSGCAELLSTSSEYGEIGGIFNLATVLHDGILANQTAAKFSEMFAPKVLITAHLDTLSRTMCPRLAYFVVFSSFSCGRGNPGQSNYGMANSIMEKIMEQRRRCCLPGKAIQWAAIGDVGIIVNLYEDKIKVDLRGTLPKRMDTCLQVLDKLLTHSEPTVACMQVPIKKQQTTNKFNLIESICQILGIDQKLISMDTALSLLGMDSLMIVEVRHLLRRELNLVLSLDEIKKVSIGQLNNATKSN